MTGLVVQVPAATVWTSQEAPRDVDEAAVRDQPDPVAWVAALDAEGTPELRLGLHGRTLTQLVAGEPAVVVEERHDWLRIAAPWQPSSVDPRGYLGWVRRAHFAPGAPHSPAALPAEVDALLASAREHLGLRYLWGGTSPWGLDCSGLVHLTCRRHGLTVPRDAFDQAADSTSVRPVALDEVRPGDLYFFARPDRPVHHVGFVSRPVLDDGVRWMLHAPEAGCIEDAPMAKERRTMLVAAGRLRGLAD